MGASKSGTQRKLRKKVNKLYFLNFCCLHRHTNGWFGFSINDNSKSNMKKCLPISVVIEKLTCMLYV